MFIYIAAICSVILRVGIATYQKWLFDPEYQGYTKPLLFISITKLVVTLIYLSIVAATKVSPGLHSRVWGSEAEPFHWKRWAPWIAVATVMIASTIALDTSVYQYLDLTTKQAIDASAPFFVLIVSLVWKFQPAPQAYQTNRRGGCNILRVLSLVCIVFGTALAVWHGAHHVSQKGVILNSITLITSSIGSNIDKHLIGFERQWTIFRMMVIMAVPSTLAVLIATFIFEDSNITMDEFSEGFMYALPVIVAGICSSVIGITILRKMSVVSTSVLGNITMGLLVVVDFAVFKKHESLTWIAGAGLVLSVVGVVSYTLVSRWRNKPEDLVGTVSTSSSSW